MQAMQGRKVEPVFVAVVDLKAPGRKANVAKAINFLKYFGLKLGMDDPGLIETLGMDEFDVTVAYQESVYLTEEELSRKGMYQFTAKTNLVACTVTPRYNESLGRW